MSFFPVDIATIAQWLIVKFYLEAIMRACGQKYTPW